MLGKRPILTKLPSQRIRLMRHNIPLIRATPFGPPMRIHLAERMNPIPKKVILRSRIHHSLNIKQVEIQSQMNKRVHIIDFHISGNNHSSQLLGHRNSSNQNQFSQLRARQDGTPRPHRRQPGGPPEALAQGLQQRQRSGAEGLPLKIFRRGRPGCTARSAWCNRAACPRTFSEVSPRPRAGKDYLSTLADHSQQPTGSPSMSTLPPSKS